MNVVWLKLFIAVILIIVSLIIDRRYSAIYAIRHFNRLPLWSAFTLLRIIPFVLIYLIAKQSAQSDVMMFWDWASHASRGEVVYRDFDNDYAPGFPYILAFSLWLWRDARSIVFLMIIIEMGVLVLTRRIFLKSGEVSENQINRASLLYLMSPAPFILTVLGGQEDIWLWGIGVIAAGFFVAKKELNAAVVTALGLLVSKAFLIFAAISNFWAARRPFLYLIGLCVPVLIGYGLLWYLIGEKVLMPLRQSSVPSPPNIWFLLNIISGGQIPLTSSWLSLASLSLVVVLGCLLFYSRSCEIQESLLAYSKAWIIVYALLMILSPKSFGNYVQMFLMPLFFVLCSRKQNGSLLVLTCLLSGLAAVQPSLWFRLGQPIYDNLSSLLNLSTSVEIVAEISILVILGVIIRLMLVRERASIPS